MISTATRIEDLTLGITEEIQVRAPLEATFAALLEQLGPFNETAEDRPMPMKLEAWPGGRWYRDLGDNNAHRGRAASARFLTPSLMCFQPPVTPLR